MCSFNPLTRGNQRNYIPFFNSERQLLKRLHVKFVTNSRTFVEYMLLFQTSVSLPWVVWSRTNDRYAREHVQRRCKHQSGPGKTSTPTYRYMRPAAIHATVAKHKTSYALCRPLTNTHQPLETIQRPGTLGKKQNRLYR